MISKLKCPFCQQELRKLFNRYTGEPNCEYECENFKCDLYGIEMPELVWQALIQAKQDLEIARKALEKYADEDMWENCCKWDIEYIQGLFLEYGYKIAKEAIEQIDHKE